MAKVIVDDMPQPTPTVELLQLTLEQLQAKGMKEVPPALGELALRIAALEHDRELLRRLAWTHAFRITSLTGDHVREYRRGGAGPGTAVLRLREFLSQLPKVPT